MTQLMVLLGGTGRSEISVPFLLEGGTSDRHVLRLACQGKGGKEGLCVFVGILRDFGFLTTTVCHYPKPV